MHRHRPAIFAVAVVTALSFGCGEDVERDTPLTLDQIPAPLLEVARKERPDLTFQNAYKIKFEGKDAYEIIGKTKAGKVVEVEVSPEGKVLAIE